MGEEKIIDLENQYEMHKRSNGKNGQKRWTGNYHKKKCKLITK